MSTDFAPAWAAGLFAGALGFLKWLFGRRTSRIETLEELIDLLRRELDKALVRGNATQTVARILLFAIDQEPDPSPAMIAAREQARDVIAAADLQLKRGDNANRA